MIRSEAFPVPTVENPHAVFTQDSYVESKNTDAAANKHASSRERQQILRELHLARVDNRKKTAEDYRRSRDMEQCKRAWKLEEDRARKEARQADLALQGIPESCAFLVETALYAARRHRASTTTTAASAGEVGGEEVDLDSKIYERSLKRMSKSGGAGEMSGAQRLIHDLEARAERNLKRARPDAEAEGINKQNAIFNKSLARTMAKDARAQAIKQSLERGTAL